MKQYLNEETANFLRNYDHRNHEKAIILHASVTFLRPTLEVNE